MFYNIFALDECINKKIHAIFHRASKQFKVDAATSHVGMAVLFSLLYPPSGAAVDMAAIFPLLYPPSNAAVGMTTLFPLLYPLPGVLHTLTNSLTRPLLGGSFHICTSFLSTGLLHPAQLPLQPLHPPQHCPLLSLRSSLRTIKKTVIAIIVIIMISAISASCPYLCSTFGYI